VAVRIKAPFLGDRVI